MGKAYKTIQGDTWDSIAYQLYGNERYMKQLIEANWDYSDVLVFSADVELTVPEIPQDEDSDLPFWKREEVTEEGGI